MSNKFTIDQLSKSQTIDPNSINRLYKINMMLNFMEIRSNIPKMKQSQICKQLGTSDSTIKRYRDDIQMDSPYKRKNYKKKKPNQSSDTTTENTSISQQTTNESVKNKIIEKRIKNRLKNEIKGGNISDTHTITGKELIDHGFESDKANSILENKQEDNKKYITIAKRMIDNSQNTNNV